MALSQLQYDAAHRAGQDVCVVAGPGSGKTSVLIERFSWLVRSQGVPPDRILAITFTEKAATEIKQRLVHEFAAELDILRQIERAYVSTIHAFCSRLLRENSIAAGVDPEFQVLDYTVSGPMLRDTADDELEALYATQPARTRKFLRALAVSTQSDGFVPDTAASLIEIYNALRDAGEKVDAARLVAPPPLSELPAFRASLGELLAENPCCNTDNQRNTHAALCDWIERFLALPAQPALEHFTLLGEFKFDIRYLMKGSKAKLLMNELREQAKRVSSEFTFAYYAAERAFVGEALEAIDRGYRARKRAESALDFADLEERAIALLREHPEIRQSVRESFDAILMDELQDTNPLQWDLLNLIRRPDRFFAVGDVNQSIFSFRHAEPALFHAYREGLPVVDVLRDNYRSRPELLTSVNRTFAPRAGIDPHELRSARDFPSKPAPSVEIVVARADETWKAERAEALILAGRIAELAAAGTRYADIAILTRTNAAMPPIQQALDANGIPSVVLGGVTFFETREVMDLLHLLTVLVNPYDDIALAGLLRSPLVGVTDEQLLALSGASPLADAVSKSQLPHIQAFWSQLTSLRKERDSISPDRLLRRMLDAVHYERDLSARARANIEKLLSLLRTRYTTRPAPLARIVAGLQSSLPEPEAPPEEAGNAVRLMTIHKSKGLEFQVVFLPSLHTGRSTGTPILVYGRNAGVGVKWRDPASRKGLADPLHNAIVAAQVEAQRREDDRLLYVAMTRAKEHLVLSFAGTDRSPGEWAKLVHESFDFDPKSVTNEWFNRQGARIQVSDNAPSQQPVAVPSAHQRQIQYAVPPEANQQYDSTASVTSISLYQACPRKYYLSRYLNWEATGSATEPRPPGSGSPSANELGSQVHAYLAGETPDNAPPEVAELANRFKGSELARRAAQATQIEREFDFLLAIEDVVLRGQIDLWFEQKGRLILVDYKTDRNAPKQLNPYQLQMQLYALALEKFTGRLPAEAWIFFLREANPVPVDLSPLELNAAHQAVRDFRDAQAKLNFPLHVGEQCGRCEFYKGPCPAEVSAVAAARPSFAAGLP